MAGDIAMAGDPGCERPARIFYLQWGGTGVIIDLALREDRGDGATGLSPQPAAPHRRAQPSTAQLLAGHAWHR
jgi:hypothetical protein